MTDSFERAIAVYAIARSLNGVISVAQGTELEVAPVGVGVSVSVGEILDPLNDLIERFSWLILLALSSLGGQLLVQDLFAHPWANVAVTVTAALLVATITLRHRWPALLGLARLTAMLLYVRVAVAALGLAGSAIADGLLADRQADAVAQLTSASSEIEAIEAPAPRTRPGLRDRFAALLEDADVSERLQELQLRVEGTIRHLVELIVTYLFETVLLPLVLLLTAYGAGRLLWHSGFWKATR